MFAVSVDSKRPARTGRAAPRVAGRAGTRPDRPCGARIKPDAAVPARLDRPILMVWKGSFESIGFPFYTGVLDQLEINWHPTFSSYDFDEAGERILIVESSWPSLLLPHRWVGGRKPAAAAGRQRSADHCARTSWASPAGLFWKACARTVVFWFTTTFRPGHAHSTKSMIGRASSPGCITAICMPSPGCRRIMSDRPWPSTWVKPGRGPTTSRAQAGRPSVPSAGILPHPLTALTCPEVSDHPRTG